MATIYLTGTKGQVIEALKDALFQTSETAFIETKNVVPVDTGALRESGIMHNLADGIIIQYRKDYASIVERGWEGGRVWTHQHIRSNGVRVKGHYKNQPARVGTKFIENTLKRNFVGTGSKTPFQNNILIALETHFPGRVVREI